VIPKEALDYLKKKNLKTGFSYRDVWNGEHATNFTVAKAMQLDVLSDIKQAVEQALEKGETFEHFKKNLAPALQQKGWWGKKQMQDPVTGKMINAQLGSGRRLKTVYATNLRSAYQEGRWERSQASASHPYLMYRVGNSRHHRKEHLAWDGLILPKDDPWWNAHYPPNGWGCKCWTQAVSEARRARLEQTEIKAPPSADGTPGHTVPVRTQAPPTRYKTWVDNRTGRVEKIPAGISPGFNWNQGRMGREVPVFDSFMKKGKDGFHEDIEAVAKTILTSQIKRDEFESFVEKAYDKKISGYRAAAAGFIDKSVASWLKKNTGMETGDSVTISLEARLLTGKKGLRHSHAGDGIGKSGAMTVIDALLYGQVYYDRGNLIYLFPHSANRMSKITVNPRLPRGGRGSSIIGPSIVNIESVGATAADKEFERITEGLQKIK
jgi:SPP1 gp7 family putative phage head morphogenesis protein